MPYVGRGDVYYYLGEDQNAIEDYTKAIQKTQNQNYAHAYYSRAFSYRRLGQHPLANADIAKACYLDSKYC